MTPTSQLSTLPPRPHPRIDLWHEVPLVPQLTGMSCWAASAAMLVGWRDCVPVHAEEVATGAGHWSAYRSGLRPTDVFQLARAWRLVIEHQNPTSVASLRTLLEVSGPLWVGEASPGLHSIVLVGLHGDGTLDGTWVRVNDPWPIGRGERYQITVRSLLDRLAAAAALAGAHPQVLHSGGRRGRVAGLDAVDH